MSQAEFQRWGAFYEENPFDDLHRYHRPAALVSVSLGGGDVQDKLDWLKPPPDTGHTGADMDLFKAAGITPPRKST